MPIFNMTGGGATFTKTGTLLWQNQNPTSSMADYTATLNGSYLEFSLLKIVFQYATSLERTTSIYIEPEKLGAEGSGAEFMFALGVAHVSGNPCARAVYRVSDTQIKFSNCRRISSGASEPQLSVPLEIYGIK